MHSIDTDKFREYLKGQKKTLFPPEENGDAYWFMVYLNDFLERLDKAVYKTKESKLCKSAFQITLSYTLNLSETVMDSKVFKQNFIDFPAHKLINFIEMSKLIDFYLPAHYSSYFLICYYKDNFLFAFRFISR